MKIFDFISEKWRTCRRTRHLAHIHVASSIVALTYITVYAEGQRRTGNNNELGAVLAAILFNIFHLMPTVPGILRPNAFVARCKDATECMRALSCRNIAENEQRIDLRAGSGTESVDSTEEERSELESGGETRELNRLSRFAMILARFNGVVEGMTSFWRRNYENNEESSRADEVERLLFFEAHLIHANDKEKEKEK